MDKLPQELIDRIFWRYLTGDDFQNTLTVSKTFQLATERASCRYRTSRLTESKLERFVDIYSGHRLDYLNSIQYRTRFLPLLKRTRGVTPADNDSTCRDSVADLQVMDETFTRQIAALFAALKTLEGRMAGKRIHVKIFTPSRYVESGCLHRKYVGWPVHLLSPATLPQIYAVGSLVVMQQSAGQTYLEEANETPAKLDLRVLLDLCVKLPNLEYLGCKLVSDDWTSSHVSKVIRHHTRPWEGPQRDTRHEFAKTHQTSNLPKTLRRIRFRFIDPFKFAENIDQLQLLPNLVKPALHDPFSSSLRLLSCNLRKLQLRVVADETLFWPSDGSIPHWPNLECLDVMFHMATPKGTWYFQGPKGEGKRKLGFEISSTSYPPTGPNDTDAYWHEYANREWGGSSWEETEKVQFRIIPDDEVLSPFLTGFAKAALYMPSLKKAALWTSLSFSASDIDTSYISPDSDSDDEEHEDGPLAWGFFYLAPGEQLSDKTLQGDPSSLRQICWKVGGWKPDPELHHLFQQIGCQHAGGLLEKWDDELVGQTLVERAFFGRLGIV